MYEEMNVERLRSSKIQKVMYSIAKLPDEARGGEFRFRTRAMVLVQKWQVVLDNLEGGKARIA
jgi:hypothetical protein